MISANLQEKETRNPRNGWPRALSDIPDTLRQCRDPHGSRERKICIMNGIPLTPHFTCDSNCFISIVEISRGAVSPYQLTERYSLAKKLLN